VYPRVVDIKYEDNTLRTKNVVINVKVFWAATQTPQWAVIPSIKMYACWFNTNTLFYWNWQKHVNMQKLIMIMNIIHRKMSAKIWKSSYQILNKIHTRGDACTQHKNNVKSTWHSKIITLYIDTVHLPRWYWRRGVYVSHVYISMLSIMLVTFLITHMLTEMWIFQT
jgi:hypothetical protein